MKAIALLLVSVGLVSAQVSPAPVVVNGGSIDPNALLNSSASGSSSFSGLSDDSNLNLQGLDLSGLNLGSGLDLGSLDFNNQNDILNAIEQMMNALCLGNLIQLNQLQQLGQVAQLQMFLELAQLMSLAQSGLVNLSEIQGLFSSGLLNSGFNAGSLFGSGGVFKREIGSHKRVRITQAMDGRTGRRRGKTS